MLGLIAKLFAQRPMPPHLVSPADPVSPVVVLTDEDGIRVRDPGHPERMASWTEFSDVTLVARMNSPATADFFWSIDLRPGRAPIRVPFGAGGEREFVRAMQVRLQGFDNMAVVEALGTMSDGRFAIWHVPVKAAHPKSDLKSVS